MGHRILLVEDHQDTASVFARMLRREGYEVVAALNCAEARRSCQREAFDLIICDIQMPDGNGTDVLQAARETHPQTVGMIVSGNDDAVHKERARGAGFVRFFLKPLDYPALLKAMSESLRR